MTSGVSTTLRSVAAADESHLWASGYGGTILRSTNGGTSWTQQASGSTVELFDVYALDRTTAWAVGGDDTLLRTTNGGSTWTNRTSAPSPDAGPTGVAAADSSRVYASTSYGDVWTSADGGATWSALGGHRPEPAP